MDTLDQEIDNITMNVSLEKIIEELQFISNRISKQVRTISISVLAIVWLFLAGGSDTPVLPSTPNKSLLFISGSFAMAVLLIDYFQYLFAYINSDQLRRKAENANKKKAAYDYTALLYRLRITAFWLKQILTLAAVSFLAVAVFKTF